MKKTLSTLILGVVLFGGFLSFCCGAGYAESVYKRPAVCSSRYNDNGAVVYEFIDTYGESWEWESDSAEEFYTIGNSYKLVMFDEKTSSIYDDSILKIVEN